ncbi:MAG: hypothetical protein DRP60_00355 [Spirochaetes bacterium]|nr:MAG: hypothetical protein DRP60_00355 [Spirochaetota bacterium]
MTSRERILSTINRNPTDRVPRDIWMTDEVSMGIKEYLGVKTDIELYDNLNIDKIVWVQAAYKGNVPELKAADENESFNEWGTGLMPKPYDGGVYLENSFYPLKGFETVAELDKYPWPDVNLFDYESLSSQVSDFSGRATMLSFISLLETYSAMRSLDEALVDLYLNPEFLHKALNRIAEIQIDYIKKALAAAPDIDIVYYSDDMGMQDRQMFSTYFWKTFLKPHVADIIETVHSLNKKVFYHSDGSAFDIIKELVDLGIDILNPIQYVCSGMEREKLKKEFGKDVIFHGAIENQKILPFGTPKDVEEEVRECNRILGEGGGYIIAPCHNIQPNTPRENIVALYSCEL